MTARNPSLPTPAGPDRSLREENVVPVQQQKLDRETIRRWRSEAITAPAQDRIWLNRCEALSNELLDARALVARAAFVAEHLMQMIDRETWRATGGDDGQGHYEGDYREEQTFAEIQSWKEIAS